MPAEDRAPARGLIIPPKLDIRDSASVVIAGTFALAETAGAANSSNVGVPLAGDFVMTDMAETTNSSEVGMLLAGDFVNEALYPSFFDWVDGRLEMNGSVPQTFEVGGIDLGPSEEGFLTDANTLYDTDQHTNFSIGTLQIGTDEHPSHVTFVNAFANTVAQGPCQEALYVDTLVLKAGSSITLDGCRLYYRALVEEAGTNIYTNNCGEALPLCAAPGQPVAETLPATPPQSPLAAGRGVRSPQGATAAAGPDPVNYKNRFISVTTNVVDAGRSLAIRVRFVSLPPPFNLWNFETIAQDFFAGEPREVCENSGKGLKTDPVDCPASLPTDTFWAAPLMCDSVDAHYMDWHGQCDGGTCVGGLKAPPYRDPASLCVTDDDCLEYVHLYNEGLVPSKMAAPAGPIDIPAEYWIQVIDSGCALQDESSYSAPLTMIQSGWGDVCGPGPGGACSAVADGIVDVANDVLGVLDKFANVNYLQKARADLEPGDFDQNNGPDFKVNVANDVLFTLSAFTGDPYPFLPGDPCSPGLSAGRD